MKKTHIFLLVAFSFCATVLSAKSKSDEVYLLGVSFSYGDSIVYFTELLPLEGVELESRSRILPNRQHYAYELKDYMTFQEGKSGRTSVIYFAKTRKKLEKIEAKVKNKILHKDKKTVRYLGDKFVFTRP